MSSLWILLLTYFAVSVAAKPGRIVGGTPTTVEEYPAIVQLELYSTWADTWSQGCAGSIVTARTIISAAHCFPGSIADTRYRRIRAGTTYRNVGGVIKYLELVLHHPSFGSNGFEGDISIVRLRTALEYTLAIQKTSIPPQGAQIPDNFPVVKAGWGYTEQGGVLSDVLRHVQIYTINNRLCAERYASLPYHPPVTENMICAGILDVGGKDGCQGDSGGPMYFTNITVGIISWGEGCANDTFPGVTIAVSSFTDWIVANAI